MKAKLINIDNIGKQGASFIFDRPIPLHGTFKSKEWWISWEKMATCLFPDIEIEVGNQPMEESK